MKYSAISSFAEKIMETFVVTDFIDDKLFFDLENSQAQIEGLSKTLTGLIEHVGKVQEQVASQGRALETLSKLCEIFNKDIETLLSTVNYLVNSQLDELEYSKEQETESLPKDFSEPKADKPLP